MRNIAAAFQTLGGFVFVHHKTIHAHAQKCAKAALCRVVVVEQSALYHLYKKPLRQVLRVFGRTVPAQPHIFVYRFPVRCAQRVHRADTLGFVTAARRVDHGPSCQREAVAAPAWFLVGRFLAVGHVVKMLVFRKSLRNLPLGSNFLVRAMNWGSLGYLAWSCFGDMVKSLPQWGRAWNAESSFSIMGKSLLTAGQSCFQVKWMVTQGCW